MLFALFVAMKTSQVVTNNLPNVIVYGKTISIAHVLSIHQEMKIMGI